MNPVYTLNLAHNVFPPKYSTSIEKINIQTNTKYHLFLHNTHSIIIDTIILPLQYCNNNRDKNKIKIINDNGNIWDLSIDLLIGITKPHIYKNNVYIKLNNILGEHEIELPFFSNKFTNIYILFESTNNFTYDLLIKKKIYYSNMFVQTQNFIYTINQYKSTNQNNPNNVDKNDALLGFFIDINKSIKKLILFVNCIAILDYDKNITPHYGNLIKKTKYWSKKNNVLFTQLAKILPPQAIKLIYNYCNNYNEYLYWFPLSIEHKNENDVTIDLAKCNDIQLKILTNGDHHRTIHYKTKKVLHIQNYQMALSS